MIEFYVGEDGHPFKGWRFQFYSRDEAEILADIMAGRINFRPHVTRFASASSIRAASTANRFLDGPYLEPLDVPRPECTVGDDRDEKIREAIRGGSTVRDVAELHGLSKSRIRQIVAAASPTIRFG
jgi:hypothetical protein